MALYKLNKRLTNLVWRSPDEPSSCGILREGFRNGHGTHRGKAGVNMFTVPPTDRFQHGDGWCLVTVLAVEGARLKGGGLGSNPYKLCVTGEPGTLSRKVAVAGFSVLARDVPASVWW
jgi:hypothetical protein